MLMNRLRRRAALAGLAAFVPFLAQAVPLRLAHADQPATEQAPIAGPVLDALPDNPDSRASVEAMKEARSDRLTERLRAALEATPADAVGDTLLSAPGGTNKTGVSGQSISLPQGAGKIDGMGESFSAQLSTGTGAFSLPLALGAARGVAQPTLNLSYSSSGGHGIAGVGWSLGPPFIARQTDRGVPAYADPAVGGAWHPQQDRFVFNGGQELVPVCLVGRDRECAGSLPEEAMPSWAVQWQYFRPRREGSFLRFFWSPDHRQWRVQAKSGETMEFGATGNDLGALESEPGNAQRIFQWNLARQYDANVDSSGHPRNIVAYRYSSNGGHAYLTDMFDTPPVSGGADASLSSYARHVRVVYENRPDVTTSYRRGWLTTAALRVTRVDVTSKTFGEPSLPRELVRRYHFTYDGQSHVTLLAAVQLEGRCPTAVAEDESGGLPSTSCPRLPPISFEYSHVSSYKADGSPSSAPLAGYEGFDERVHAMQASPPFSLNENETELFDIDADALPDVLVTSARTFNGNHGVFFNGAGGAADSFGSAVPMSVDSRWGVDANVLKLSNANVASLDANGDAIADLLHMPKVKNYSVYSPQRVGAAWQWVGKPVAAAGDQDVKIDFQGGHPRIRVADVNGDGLVDVIHSSPTRLETFFSLGRFPGGEGQYGEGRWLSASTAGLSLEPRAACVPWSATPIRFDSRDVKLADLNGDGLGVRLHWSGHGAARPVGPFPTVAHSIDATPA